MKKRSTLFKSLIFCSTFTILLFSSKVDGKQKMLICEVQSYTGKASSLKELRTQTWQLKVDFSKNSIEKYKYLGENSYYSTYSIISSSANKLIAYEVTSWEGISSLVLDWNTKQLSYVHHFLKPNRESLSVHYGFCRS